MKKFNLLFALLFLINHSLLAQPVGEEFLILYIDFNEGTLLDKSIHQHNIVDHSTSFGEGIQEDGLVLQGIENYLEIPHATTLELPNVVTTSVWYKHQSQSNNGFFPLVEQSANVFGGHSRHGSWVFQGNRIQTCIEPDACVGGATLCQRCVSSSEILEEGKWYHIVSMYDGETLKIYVNGDLNVEETFNPSTGISVLPYSLTIGYDMYSQGSNYLKGNLDEVKIFNTVLTEDEIGQLYSEFTMTLTQEITNSDFSIYPNPTSDWLFINASFEIEQTNIIYSNGKILKEIEWQHQNRIDVSSLPMGWYLIQLINGNQVFSKRFFIHKN